MSLFLSQIPDMYLDLLPALEEIAYLENEAFQKIYSRVFDVRKPKKPGSFVNVTGMVGTGLFSVKTEGASTAEDTIYQGYDKKFSPYVYGLKVLTSKEASSDDNFGVTKKHAAALGQSSQASRETLMFGLLNGGFDSITSPDGQYWFDTDHSLPRGGTFANELASGVDLDFANIQLLLNLFNDMVEVDGIAQNWIPKQIIFPAGLQFAVAELLKSTLEPDSANNNINSVKDLFSLEPVKVPVYLTDTDAFFLSCGPKKQGGRMYVWEDFAVTSDYDPDKAVGKTIARERWAYGVAHSYGIVGSPGA
jgi:hypothetical protein